MMFECGGPDPSPPGLSDLIAKTLVAQGEISIRGLTDCIHHARFQLAAEQLPVGRLSICAVGPWRPVERMWRHPPALIPLGIDAIARPAILRRVPDYPHASGSARCSGGRPADNFPPASGRSGSAPPTRCRIGHWCDLRAAYSAAPKPSSARPPLPWWKVQREIGEHHAGRRAIGILWRREHQCLACNRGVSLVFPGFLGGKSP